jgi:2,4-dichlorophenol 6-monooxygenase
VVGPGREVLDTYDDWARLCEVTEPGCVLVRPDAHVAWRSAGLPADPSAELERVLAQVLGWTGGDGPGRVPAGAEATA